MGLDASSSVPGSLMIDSNKPKSAQNVHLPAIVNLVDDLGILVAARTIHVVVVVVYTFTPWFFDNLSP